jgi:hypothetical protein
VRRETGKEYVVKVHLLTNTSEVNKGNSLTVAPGSAVLVLGPLSALVVESKG